jgi:segregation and condensation protein A
MKEEKDFSLTAALPAFDGPFDLLLAMIRRNEYPAESLPVTEITRQFLDYVRSARALDMELGAEFLETGSWLVLLKSRSLLPGSAQAQAAREELQQAIMDCELLERARRELARRALAQPRIHPPGIAAPAASQTIEDEPAPPTAGEIAAALRRAIETARAERALAAGASDAESIEQTIIRARAEIARQWAGTPLNVSRWLAEAPPPGRAALFLALLEMARSGEILLHQNLPGSPIRLKALPQIWTKSADKQSILLC